MATKCNCYLQYLILRHNGYLTSTICPLSILWYSELGQCSFNQSELWEGLYSSDIIQQIFEFSNLLSNNSGYRNTCHFVHKQIWNRNGNWESSLTKKCTHLPYIVVIFFAIRRIQNIIVTRHLLKGAYYHQSTVAKTSFVLKGSKKML